MLILLKYKINSFAQFHITKLINTVYVDLEVLQLVFLHLFSVKVKFVKRGVIFSNKFKCCKINNMLKS